MNFYTFCLVKPCPPAATLPCKCKSTAVQCNNEIPLQPIPACQHYLAKSTGSTTSMRRRSALAWTQTAPACRDRPRRKLSYACGLEALAEVACMQPCAPSHLESAFVSHGSSLLQIQNKLVLCFPAECCLLTLQRAHHNVQARCLTAAARFRGDSGMKQGKD